MSVKFILDNNGRIDFPASGTLDSLSSYTLSAWIYAISYGDDTTGGTNGAVVQRGNSGNTYYFRMQTYSEGLNTLLFEAATFGTNEGLWKMPNNSISLNTWYHVAVTFNASSTSNNPAMYLNGLSKTVTELEAPSGTIQAVTSGNVYIGNNGSKTIDFDGYITDVRIYNSILTASQVAALYSAGAHSANFDTNLVFHAPLNNCTALSGSAYDGYTLTSSQIFYDRIGCAQGTSSGSPLGSSTNPS